jgi:hypothetical protein
VLGAVDGAMLGVVGVVPGVPDEPPLWQPTLAGAWGVVEVPPLDGAVAPGAVDGAGLAAETMATPPPTRRRPEIIAATTARRTPLVSATGCGLTAGSGAIAGGRVGSRG